MAIVAELLRAEEDGTLSFGNYTLDTKSKLSDFEHDGDIYKVKTFNEITKLERNGVFVYESVPGTAVNNFYESDKEMKFSVEGEDDASITVEAENGAEYKVYVDGVSVGTVTANMGGKLVLSVELNKGQASEVKLIKE
ncbi:MAG: endosialidase [Lachnospiraceae bacterium]|nr:endosialidase [Lachnospiraceae bacterium]